MSWGSVVSFLRGLAGCGGPAARWRKLVLSVRSGLHGNGCWSCRVFFGASRKHLREESGGSRLTTHAADDRACHVTCKGAACGGGTFRATARSRLMHVR